MTVRSWPTGLIEVLLVLLLAAVAVYSFSTSSAFHSLVDLIADTYPFETWQLSLSLAAVISVAGLVFLMVPAKPRIGFFILLVLAFCAPSLLAFSSAGKGWIGAFGDRFTLETTMTVTKMLVIALFVVAAYLYLRHTVRSRDRMRRLADRGCDTPGVEEVYCSKQAWASIVIVAAVIAASLVAATSRLLQYAIEQHTGGIPDEAVFIGILFCVAVLGIVYLLLARVRLSALSNPEQRESLARADLERALEIDKTDRVNQANSAYKLAIETGKTSGTPGGLEDAAIASLNLGVNLDHEYTLHMANRAYEQSIEAGMASGTPDGRETASQAALNLGINLNKTDKLEEANIAYQKSMETGAASGTPEGLVSAAKAALYLSRNLEEVGKVQEAIEAYRRVQQLAEASGTLEGEGIADKAARALLGIQDEQEHDYTEQGGAVLDG